MRLQENGESTSLVHKVKTLSAHELALLFLCQKVSDAMMEGVEFQYRPSSHASQTSHYPLTFDQHLAQGDRYREAAEQLNAALQSIDQFYSSSRAVSHTGNPTCQRCAEKRHRINQAYREYYLGEQPGRWDEHLTMYRQEIQRMFDRSDVPLDAIHNRFKAELKLHLSKDMCTILPNDSKNLVNQKSRLDHLLHVMSIEDALANGFQEKVFGLAAMPGLDGQSRDGIVGDATHSLGFNVRLQGAKTNEERSALYIAYYCTPASDDAPQMRNLKTKYAKLFESGKSHDTVLGMWNAETRELKTREVEHLEQRLVELKMAQSAHLKNQNKKKMEKDAKMKEKKDIVDCTLPRCDKQMDKSKEGVHECVACDWLARRTGQRRHFYYCSPAHANDDFHDHDRNEHACIMGSECYYYSSPPELEVCGICQDCMENDMVIFFCSQECYAYNFSSHANEYHARGGSGGDEGFICFQPVPGIKLDAT